MTNVKGGGQAVASKGVLKRAGEGFKAHRLFFCYAAVYFVLNLLFLTDFPFVHSDEAWLSGLSRNMLETGSLGVTETFFNIKPRNPHAIKTIFHLVQIAFIKLFGYSIFAFRLISLLCALPCLWFTYRIGERLGGSKNAGLFAAVILSLDVQFIYAGHFARQEMPVLLCMLAVFYLLISGKKHAYIWAGVVTGLSVGLHPNSFLVATMGAFVCAAIWVLNRRVRWKEPLAYAGITAAFAAFFVALSLSFNKSFFRDYLAYGEEFEVAAPMGSKIKETWPYFQRLYYRVSGTYYTPEIRFELILFLLLIVCAAVFLLFKPLRKHINEKLILPLAAIVGIWAGMAIVGRYNQTYVVFFFPFCYLLAAMLLASLLKKRALAKRIAAVCLCAAVAAGTAFMVVPVLQSQRGAYGHYLDEIALAVPPNAKTIGNLNAEYHFENGALLDYRNLSYLKAEDITLRQYIADNEVEYLIISDELLLLYELRPVWNGIYGNINYLDQLDEIIEECVLVHEFTDNLYGVRLVRYQNSGRDFNIRIYRLPLV